MDFTEPFFITNSVEPLLAATLAPGKLVGFFTNTVLFSVLVTIGILIFTSLATRKMEMVPNKKQNFVEFVIEFLYNQVIAIVGEKVAPKAFPILALIFIFVLVSNWCGLIPGVGTVGYTSKKEYLTDGGFLTVDSAKVYKAVKDKEYKYDDEGNKIKDPQLPFTAFFRPPTSDLNFTLALAGVFMLVWGWITFKEIGIKGFYDHTFGVKGGLQGFMRFALIPIFFIVGIIEIISIASRPVSLSLRLFGNIFAGETLLHTMLELGRSFGISGVPLFLMSCVLPLPFYFMEILVGVLQALVFALLCAVFIKLSTDHGDEHH